LNRAVIEEKLIKKERLMIIGLRKIFEIEKPFLEENKIQNISAKEIHLNFEEAKKKLSEFLQKQKNIYLSIDIDALDPSIAPGTGYLEENGLNEKEFFEKLDNLMDLAKESLEIKRKTLEAFTEKNLYPYSKFYLSEIKKMRGTYWANHFSTIGLIGMNEALMNFMEEKIFSDKGIEFTKKVLDFMREKLIKYQKETGNIYNLEATPAEGTSYRLAKQDKEFYPKIITAGKDTPYYTNSTQLPVDYTEDIFEALEKQDELQIKYTGGTVFHSFLGEKIYDTEVVKNLIKKIFICLNLFGDF